VCGMSVVDRLPCLRLRGEMLVAPGTALQVRLNGVEVRGRRQNLHTSVVSLSTTGQKKRNLTLIGGGGCVSR
jgi:hypothetical protein